MKVWRITFKDGIQQTATNYHHLTHGEYEYVIKERTTNEKETTVGKLFWKKKEKVIEEGLQAILVVPIGNVMKVELEEFKIEI